MVEKFKMYEMILDQGSTVSKEIRPALSEVDLKERYSGNGEFVRIQDVTDEYPISSSQVDDALKAAGFNDPCRVLIISLLIQHYDNTYA